MRFFGLSNKEREEHYKQTMPLRLGDDAAILIWAMDPEERVRVLERARAKMDVEAKENANAPWYVEACKNKAKAYQEYYRCRQFNVTEDEDKLGLK